jgi:hypothetical protein
MSISNIFKKQAPWYSSKLPLYKNHTDRWMNGLKETTVLNQSTWQEH